MRAKAVNDKTDDDEYGSINCVLGDALANRHYTEIDADRADARQDRDCGKDIGRDVATLMFVKHRVQDDADDREDQENVLCQQYDGLVLDEQPQYAENRKAQEIDRPLTA